MRRVGIVVLLAFVTMWPAAPQGQRTTTLSRRLPSPSDRSTPVARSIAATIGWRHTVQAVLPARGMPAGRLIQRIMQGDRHICRRRAPV